MNTAHTRELYIRLRLRQGIFSHRRTEKYPIYSLSKHIKQKFPPYGRSPGCTRIVIFINTLSRIVFIQPVFKYMNQLMKKTIKVKTKIRTIK